MGSPRYSELGLSLGILEEDLRWYWKLLASISAWLLLAGFVVFPLAMDHNAKNMRGGTFPLTAAATVLIFVGYLTFMFLLCDPRTLGCKDGNLSSQTLVLTEIRTPHQTMLRVEPNRRLTPLTSLSIAAVIISTVSAAAFGIAAIYNSHNVVFIPRRFGFRRGHKGEPSVDDAELQRRQLLRLYFQQDADRAPSPDVSQSTFRIDLPDPGVDGYEELTLKPHRQTYPHGLPPSPPPGYDPGRVFNRSSTPTKSIRKGSLPGMPRSKTHGAREMRMSIVELGDL
ncbi:hypothetical protein ACO22_01166 [Paracoccidioides brasiliensis]|uniref:Uncharacterized protein n=1 Tax=Paracoccidioides brasiliensis TaxID=121759 RepID=A0A1D2JMB1_PARBR|nr:hypothetical protein ACO22_01166 [Paracoccidioides brasiliensis]ODH45976.1 hypothetical protein GX48_07950 [Paracoccidioides brasiliensis]